MKKRIQVFPERCIGCRSCELACSLEKENQFKPSDSRVGLLISQTDTTCFPVVCFQCEDAPCLDACPAEAIKRNKASGIVKIFEDDCTGCGECLSACPFGNILLDREQAKAKKCDLCDGNPACVEFCPTQALQCLDRQDPFEAKKFPLNPFYTMLHDFRLKN
jgi:Fe-S-cluster-containing hydrogenase component 2